MWKIALHPATMDDLRRHTTVEQRNARRSSAPYLRPYDGAAAGRVPHHLVPTKLTMLLLLATERILWKETSAYLPAVCSHGRSVVGIELSDVHEAQSCGWVATHVEEHGTGDGWLLRHIADTIIGVRR